MTLKEEIAQRLTEAEGYINGEQLAAELGKSRAAVWKAVKALQNDGWKIVAVRNRGYALSDDNDLLSEQKIRAYLKTDMPVYYYPVIDSTNTQAKRLLAEDEAACPALLVANEQSAGRGRQGKSFYSPADSGAYFSLVLKPEVSLQNAVSATTAAAVAVCRALERLTDAAPQIKWVNDVYLGSSKICGILTEAVTDFESGTVSAVIIGIGVNVSTLKFPDDIPNAGSLGKKIKRAELIAAVTDELIKIAFCSSTEYIDYYRAHSMLIGRKICFIENGRATAATALEIDGRGGLVVKTENGKTKTLRSGEISVKF